MEAKIAALRKLLDDSKYTVALCGSGMTEEGGFIKVKKPERAYDLEQKYGFCAEEMFSSAFYNTRPEQFFEFYKNELLEYPPAPTASGPALAAMEKAGKLQSIITSNIFEQTKQAGCQHVINLHGSIFENICPRCGRHYTLEEVKQAARVPLCTECNVPIRPLVNLYGEMVDSQLMTKATVEVEKADVLMLLGTTIDSEVFGNYIKYFEGRWIVIIHRHSHYLDQKADMLFLDDPKNILPELGYE